MGYRDDFYNETHYIGRTGNSNSTATYYFHNTKTHEFGHITQHHEVGNNIGREKVLTDLLYQYQKPPYTTLFWEFSPKHMPKSTPHTSRNKFTRASQAHLSALKITLKHFTKMKTRYAIEEPQVTTTTKKTKCCFFGSLCAGEDHADDDLAYFKNAILPRDNVMNELTQVQ